jgi:hypothetical protein
MPGKLGTCAAMYAFRVLINCKDEYRASLGALHLKTNSAFPLSLQEGLIGQRFVVTSLSCFGRFKNH